MALSSNRITHFRQRLYIPISEFQGFTGASVGAGANPGTVAEFGATGVVGLLWATTTSEVFHFMAIPDNWDRDQPIYVRVVWISDSETATDAATFTFTYRAYQGNAQGQDFQTATNIALDTPIVSDLVLIGTAGAPEVLQVTEPGIIAGGMLMPSSTVPPDRYMKFLVALTARTGIPNVYLLGVEFEFSPKTYRGITAEAAAWEVR